MSLYRGAGGASDATDDSTVNAVAGYASAAASSASSAATSATEASTSASAAASSASGAASSASSVATNAANAATSASSANTYATQAGSSKDAAAASAVIASTKAGEASSSASTASSASATATTKAGEAVTSADEAAASAVASADSAADALAIYGNTASMEAAVAAVAASAASATTQAANAAASAVDADESEELAYEHEQNAAEWATVAQGAANSSQAYSSASAAARDAALAALDSFDDRYLGQKAADPTVDNDGNTLIAGALYFNNQDNVMKVYEGSVWVAAYASLSGALLVNNNLSDVASVSAARTNLGLGTAATTDSTAYATAAQGTKADTAFGWGNHASAGYAQDSAVVKLTGDQVIAGTKTFSSTITGSITGNAGTVTSGVYTTGDQTIAGTKTFSSTISGSVSGNAGTVTNGVYTTGDQTIAGTKTLSSNPVLSVGTANGITYLNGSKVLTTGSALTFDGNAKLAVNGGASLNGELQLVRSSGFPGNFTLTAGGVSSDSNITLYDTTSGYVAAYRHVSGASGYHNWFQNGTEQMRLTSTGLGIGTSSPGYKLDVVDAGGNLFRFARTTEQIGAYVSAGNVYFGTLSNNPLLLMTNGTAKATLDSSGNLGLGVTPSAWSSNVKAIEFNDASVASYSAAGIYSSELRCNSIGASGGEVYKNTARASSFGYDTNAGAYYWKIAPSGTAGNAISFTQAMTLDASGNLLVGTTSAAYQTSERVGIATTSSNPVALGIANGNYNSAGIAIYNGYTATGAATAIKFADHNSVVRGSITVTTSATAYNTSSDYRLKNITGPITTSGAYIDSLNPVEGTWKADGSTFVGLIAHEAQEVSRTQVATGVKDGEEMQGMSYSSSEMIANMIAELKALRARVAALEAA